MSVQMLKKVYVKLSLQYFNRYSFFTDKFNLVNVKKSVESRTLFHMLTTLLQKIFL